jgi:hypothetical protein
MHGLKILLISCSFIILPTNGWSQTKVEETAADMQVGEFRELTTKNMSKDLLAANGGHNILQYAGKGTWDPTRQEFNYIGKGAGSGNITKHIRFSILQNSWSNLSALPPNLPEFGHSYEHNAMNPQTGDHYYRHYNSTKIDKYIAASQTWTTLPPVPTTSQTVANAIEYFPELQGLIFIDSGAGVWHYSEASGKWSHLATWSEIEGIGPYHNFAIYIGAPHNVVLFGGGNGSRHVFKLNSNGKVTRLADSPIPMGPNQQSLQIENKAKGTMVVFFEPNKIVYEYDPQNNSWNPLGSHPIHEEGTAVSTTLGVALIIDRPTDPRVWLYKFGSSVSGDTIPPDPPQNLKVN